MASFPLSAACSATLLRTAMAFRLQTSTIWNRCSRFMEGGLTNHSPRHLPASRGARQYAGEGNFLRPPDSAAVETYPASRW